MDTVKVNSRHTELEFLSSILRDLYNNYEQHHTNIVHELLQTVEYRLEKEEITIKAKAKSEQYNNHKR